MSKDKSIHSIESERLCEWLNAKRSERKVTIRQLADQLKWSHAVVGKIFLGDRKLDVIEYGHICDALAVDACEGLRHMSGKPPHTPPPLKAAGTASPRRR